MLVFGGKYLDHTEPGVRTRNLKGLTNEHRATIPTVWLLAEAAIRRRPGSDAQKDGFFEGRFLTRPWGLSCAQGEIYA